MLPKFSFLVKLQHQEPEVIDVTANDLGVAAQTATLAAQHRLGRKMNLYDGAGFPCAAGNQVEQLQLLGLSHP